MSERTDLCESLDCLYRARYRVAYRQYPTLIVTDEGSYRLPETATTLLCGVHRRVVERRRTAVSTPLVEHLGRPDPAGDA